MTMLKGLVHIAFWTGFLYIFGLVLPASGWAMVLWLAAILLYMSRVLAIFSRN